jgi:hypothetical protein
VEHRQVEGRPAASGRASGDDTVRFLRELRQLRDGAGLGQAELAARAHYPYDRIMAAEVGPTLPDLPVLSAYVRGCGGTTEEWEERWRSLTSAPTLPLLDARPTEGSTAASAGARIGAISPAADTPDPAVILAALDRVGEGMAVGAPTTLPSRAAVSTIEQRPAGATPAAAKPTTAKAASPKVVAWETTTMRTAWSSAAGPTTQETRQASPGVGSATSGAAVSAGGGASAGAATTSGGAPGTEGSRTVPAQSRTAGYLGTDAAKTGTAGTAGATGTAGPSTAVSGGVTSAATAASSGSKATSAPTTTTAPKSAGRSRSRASRGLSRTTLVALIAIAICVLAAALAIFA